MFISGLAVFAGLAGCSGTPHHRTQSVTDQSPDCCESRKPAPSRDAIVKSAAYLVGSRSVEVNGRHIEYDCAGVTRAVFLEHGIDLYETPSSGTRANGVQLIYDHIQQHGRLHSGPAALPGDLVFFDNTWDFNRDGRTNDPLTHVGIVEKQDRDGTMTFISRVAGSVERYRMNLGLPHIHRNAKGKVLNDYIRRRGSADPPQTAYLTGELFAGFGARTGL